MIRSALIAFSVIASVTAALGQPLGPVRTLTTTLPGQWAVVQIGQDKAGQCVVGLRSDAAAPAPGQPQFMISADQGFAILRVRAAEWSFPGGRDIAVTLATDEGSQRTPAAVVRGRDLIDISLGVGPDLGTLARSGHLVISAEGTDVRLPLKGLAEVLPAYRDCLAGLGTPGIQASLAR
jgi:hypothetical protein